MDLFVRGLIIGFSIAAPVGPIGVLCIRRTLAYGRFTGLASGLGAASADAIYGAIAGFGLTVISSFLVDQQMALRIVGGAFLCYLGIKTLRARLAGQTVTMPDSPSPTWLGWGVGGGVDLKPIKISLKPNHTSLGSAYLSTFALTLTNPATILSFVAIFAGVGIAESGQDTRSALTLVAGVFSGSAAWWVLLSGGMSLLRDVFTPGRMQWVNTLSGVILLGFGLLALSGTL